MINYEYKVTIGFPVYNVEHYVYRSLESVLNQDFDDYEVIVVDDCGIDNSMEVIKELIDNHPNGDKVRIISHEKNAGLAEARNTAIKNAKGKYIYFLDSDDYITPNALSTLYSAAEKYQADVVWGSNYKQRGEDVWTEKDNILPYKVFQKDGEFTSYLYSRLKEDLPDTAWNILFSMDFLNRNHLQFPNIRFQEDIAFDEIYHPCIRNAVMLPDLTYYYLLREDSLMNIQSRESISSHEVERSIELCKLLKGNSEKWKNDPIYGGVCAKIMRRCFFQVAGVLKHRNKFTSNISDREIRDMMKHPLSLINIVRFKQLRKYNLFFYILGALPPKLSVYAIEYICKKKGYLRLNSSKYSQTIEQ